MRRLLLRVLTYLSLLLLVVAMVMWLRSYRHVDQVGRRATFGSPGGHWVDEQFRGLVSDQGGFVLLSAKRRENADGSRPPPAAGGRFEWRVDPRGWDVGYTKLSDPLLGFESNYKVTWSGNGGLLHDEWRWIRAPYWCVATLTAALPLSLLTASARRRKKRSDANQPAE